MPARSIKAVDLFCGAGGTSTGLRAACHAAGLPVQLLAINHWDVAISTHSRNHPEAEHLCMDIEAINPRKVVPDGRLHFLLASPECTHHSNARGGKPMSDQSRASAWHILRWCEALYIENLLIENVKEFRDWGPLGANGRPLKSKKGQLYNQFLRSLRALGYRVDARIVNAAHYGDATSRQRLFIQARRGERPIVWPDPTHVAPGELDLYAGAQRWRTAREIIDWSLPGKSIYTRKKPLAPNTMRRILAGLQKFCGLPFVVGSGGPVGQGAPHSVDAPLGTILTDDHRALVEPFLVVFRNKQDARSLDRPLPTMTTSGANFGLCQPYLVALEHSTEGHERRCRSLDQPVPTITGKAAFGLCEPFLVKYFSGSDACSVDEPLPTVTANNENLGLCQPFLVEYHGGKDSEKRIRSLDTPIPTQDTSNRFGLCQPFLVNYNGTGTAHSLDEPLDTITAKDRFGLVESGLLDKGDRIALLDIRFRMLQPHELAAAMSFPADYAFTGTRDHQVKQIGNAVPVQTAKALCQAMLKS